MTTNLFDHFDEDPSDTDVDLPWRAQLPRRQDESFDLLLVSTASRAHERPALLRAIERIEAQPWAAAVSDHGKTLRLRLADSWVQDVGAELQAGGAAEATLADLAHGERFSVQFWDANATKALHIGHLRNLAIGNSLAAALHQAGAHVERRSRISDMGRGMGEAMAGVLHSDRHAQGLSNTDSKSDHFVGMCYADYVAAATAGGDAARNPEQLEHAEDSLSREVTVQHDEADELIKRVLSGEPDALALWYKTRAWVISGQRRTLSRLGIPFDRVLFESDFLQETNAIAESGLDTGILRRREDGVVVYDSGVAELAEVPLVRADGVSTQHLRSLTYALHAPDLDGLVSMQVTGSEWLSHLTSIRKLAAALRPDLNGSFHPSSSIFHGMVSIDDQALHSSGGAFLIDDLLDWINAQIDGDPRYADVRSAHPYPERIASQLALAYFLHDQVASDIDFDPANLFSTEDSLGWDLVRARAHSSPHATLTTTTPAKDPDYRYAVLQSELYRRYLRLAVERRDVWPLAHYLKRLARWYLKRPRSEHVESVVHTILDRSARGLGLEAPR